MTIKKQSFTLALLPPPPIPGEQVFYGNGTNVFSFVVPANVYFISAVVVGVSNGPTAASQVETKISRGATSLLSSIEPIAGAVGGGNGGNSGNGVGGGAGGYTGNGGDGGWFANGGNGNGGGGGGSKGDATNAGYGGGVGLYGQGANGAGATVVGAQGGKGSPAPDGNAVGIAYNVPGAMAGGNLRWKNGIQVTPGETLTVTLASTYAPNTLPNGAGAGARIIWGNDGRSYPSNAPDSIPAGQQVFSLLNTTFTVPANVYSVSVCCQQQSGSSSAVSVIASSVIVCRAQNGARIGDGGGDGGAAGGPSEGGGGAGGYTGSGGAGGTPAIAPTAGGGGGGGGGYGSSSTWVLDPVWGGSGGPGGHWETTPASPGGGVGIQGQGASGAAGGGIGSPDPINGPMGGGAPGVAGGALAYKNSIAVTPGQVITVNAAGGRIRIIWGPGRSYPSTAGNV